MRKPVGRGLAIFPFLSLAFLSLTGFTIFLDSFEAAILKVSLLVFHMVAGTGGFPGPAMLVPRSGWDKRSLIEECRHCTNMCSYDCCSEGGLEAELPGYTLGHSIGWGSK